MTRDAFTRTATSAIGALFFAAIFVGSALPLTPIA
jgi:hypothetical protein